MTSIRKAALACMTTAMMVALSLNAAAQGPRNQDTFFTFSQPVELPNKTLPAGTYFFQLMDSESNRHIVKVMDKDRKELFATVMAIPYYSTERPSDDPQVRFMETRDTAAAAGTSPTNAIKIWFYPGNTVGHEFIYPRAQALKLAARTNTTVLTTKTDAEDSELTRVDAAGADLEANATARTSQENPEALAQQTAPAAASQPAPAPEQPREQVGAITGGTTTPEPARTEPAPAPAPEPAPAPAPRRDLPHTAGALPLLALMGLGSLVGSHLAKKAQ